MLCTTITELDDWFMEKAKKIAAKLISYKMYTCNEVYKKLVQKGIDDDIAQATVDEFVKAGILDDMEYAKLYIHDAQAIGLKGMYRIRQELLSKGVASSVIEKAANECEIDPEEMLENYVTLRFGDKQFSDYKELEKAKAHLLRRGFAIGDINRCFKKLDICVVRGDDE